LFSYGLETGLYVLIAGACVAASIDIMRREQSMGAVARLGALAGLAALARIDFLMVFATFMGAALLRLCATPNRAPVTRC
jgi:hypothetical protein